MKCPLELEFVIFDHFKNRIRHITKEDTTKLVNSHLVLMLDVMDRNCQDATKPHFSRVIQNIARHRRTQQQDFPFPITSAAEHSVVENEILKNYSPKL